MRRHFKVLAHLEEDNYGVDTFRHNQPGIPVYFPLDRWPTKTYAGVNLVYCNPPCRAWSQLAGKKFDSWKTNPAVQCTRNAFTLLGSIRPDAWAWESVTGAWTRGKELVDAFAATAMKLGYSVTVVLHDAQWLGVPQRRKRFFMVCHRYEVPWQLPNWNEPMTTREALQFIKPGEAINLKRHYFAEQIPYIKPGEPALLGWQRWRKATRQRLKRNRHGFVIGRPGYSVHRLHPDKPSHTITGAWLIHPWHHRLINLNEMKVLNGFPVDYELIASGFATKASLIARGVCPPVGAWLAKNLAAMVKEHERIRRPRFDLLDLRKPPGYLLRYLVPGEPVDLTRLIALNGGYYADRAA